jgi:hypothetical protein
VKDAFLILIVWIVTILLILGNIIVNPTSFITNGTILLGWLLFAIQLTWNQSEKFYMLVKRLWFHIKNPECVWNMEVTYHGDFDKRTFDTIDKVFLDKAKNKKIIPISHTRKIYNLDTLSFEVSLNENEGTLQMSLLDLEVTYRRSKRIIEEDIAILFEEINSKLKTDKSLYSLIIYFNDYNPYYGFFVRRMKAKDIQTFNVKFNVESDKVSIGKKQIEINTSTLQNLNTFSKNYLALSPR